MDIKTSKFGVGEIIRKGWQVYWANLTNILLAVLCVYIPINIIISFIPNGEIGSTPYKLRDNVSALIEGLFGIIVWIAIAYIAEKGIQGENIGWTKALKHGFSRWGSAIGTIIMASVIMLALMLLLIVPGIIQAVYYSFIVYVVALRSIGGKAALDYSKNLVKGQWWRVAGISWLIFILYSLVNFIFAIPFAFLPTHQIVDVIRPTVSNVIEALYYVMMVIFFLNTDYLKNPAAIAPVDSVEEVIPATQL